MIKWIILLFLFGTQSVIAATNPIDIQLTPAAGLPATTQTDNTYTASYTFTNHLPFSKLIHVTATPNESQFTVNNLCNQVALAPESSCTVNIQFQPTTAGAASIQLILAYDHNMISLNPLSTTVASRCGMTVYPPNTGLAPPDPILTSSQVWQFLSAPTLHPMKVFVSSYDPDSLANGLIFNGPYAASGDATYGQSGALIADNDGNPIWFRPLNNVSLMNTDVKVQELHGNPVLTFWQGTLATPPVYTNLPGGGAESGACYYIMDNQYHVIKTVSAFYDFVPDVHEFLITPSNTALFFATKVVPMDLTPYGGPANGAIHDFSIQEVDLATNQLLFFWDAMDHISLTSTHMPASTATLSSNVWDPYHLNSLGLIDGSNDILFSGRNTWTIYRLNKGTQNFVWTLDGNGKDGSIKIPDDEPNAHFAWQHDARYMSGDVISMFDDECCAIPGNIPPGTTPSHGLILSLDLTHNTASLQTSYYHDPSLFASSQGNNQALENFNQFLGFGSAGYFSEFAQAGNTEHTASQNLLYDAHMPGSNMSYRSYRMTWIGEPYYPPSITVKSEENTTVAYVSWNGSTETKSWKIYAGSTTNNLQLVASANKTGFETSITVASQNNLFFQAQAINGNGDVIGTSSIVAPS